MCRKDDRCDCQINELFEGCEFLFLITGCDMVVSIRYKKVCDPRVFLYPCNAKRVRFMVGFRHNQKAASLFVVWKANCDY